VASQNKLGTVLRPVPRGGHHFDNDLNAMRDRNKESAGTKTVPQSRESTENAHGGRASGGRFTLHSINSEDARAGLLAC